MLITNRNTEGSILLQSLLYHQAQCAASTRPRLTVSRVVCFDHGYRRHVPQVNTSCATLTPSAMNSGRITPQTEEEEPVRLCLCLFK